MKQSFGKHHKLFLLLNLSFNNKFIPIINFYFFVVNGLNIFDLNLFTIDKVEASHKEWVRMN